MVGCNAWVLHQNKEVFSEDANAYRPERCLESEGANPARVVKMKPSMFQFGAGSRICIEKKNISLMETYKMLHSFAKVQGKTFLMRFMKLCKINFHQFRLVKDQGLIPQKNR